MFDIKTYLRENGWKTKVCRGPTRTQGKVSQNTDIQRYDTFKTRYTLFYESRRFGICGLTHLINFNLSVIDNKLGEEIFIVSGEACEGDVIEKFRDWTEGRPIK